ncbi:hypothetical protein ID866_7490 [Astraeus odoratus]|nr:hypothetical protein ID866_7490 [Astraeus odoratus]
MADPSAAFAHIISQTRQNIELLIAHHLIAEMDGRDILARLPPPTGTNFALVEESPRQGVPVHVESSPSLSEPFEVEARVLRDWHGEGPTDLSLQAGEIIQIIAETPTGWCTGRNRVGGEGLFPATYVQKIASSPWDFPPSSSEDSESDTASIRAPSTRRHPSSSTPTQQSYSSRGSGNHFTPHPGQPHRHDPLNHPRHRHYGPPGPPRQYSSSSYGPASPDHYDLPSSTSYPVHSSPSPQPIVVRPPGHSSLKPVVMRPPPPPGSQPAVIRPPSSAPSLQPVVISPRRAPSSRPIDSPYGPPLGGPGYSRPPTRSHRSSHSSWRA